MPRRSSTRRRSPPPRPTSCSRSGTRKATSTGAGSAATARPSTPTSFPLCEDANSEQRDPAVAFDGTDFVVTWRDGRMGNGGYALWARPWVAVTGAGTEGCGFLVSDRMGDNQPPKIADGAGTSVVVWATEPASAFAVRIQGNAPLDATPIALDSGHGRQPAVVRGADIVIAINSLSGS